MQTINEGGVATFTATASGRNTRGFKYQWFKLARSGKSVTVGSLRSRHLIINNARLEDEGLYYSCVSNEWNNTKCSLIVNLTINGKVVHNKIYVHMTRLLNISLAASSVFTTHPQDQFIHNKEDAIFECAVNRSESLTINWTRNNEYITPNSHYKTSIKITNEGKISVLELKQATVDDSGVYRCIATNTDNHETVFSKLAELLSKIKT